MGAAEDRSFTKEWNNHIAVPSWISPLEGSSTCFLSTFFNTSNSCARWHSLVVSFARWFINRATGDVKIDLDTICFVAELIKVCDCKNCSQHCNFLSWVYFPTGKLITTVSKRRANAVLISFHAELLLCWSMTRWVLWVCVWSSASVRPTWMWSPLSAIKTFISPLEIVTSTFASLQWSAHLSSNGDLCIRLSIWSPDRAETQPRLRSAPVTIGSYPVSIVA